MSQMLKSSGAMAAATMISRVLGFVRVAVFASFMGITPVASAFTLAFQIPNLFRRLLGEGALSAAFIPIFKEKEKIAGEKEMWRAANAAISALLLASASIIVVATIVITVLIATDFSINLPSGGFLAEQLEIGSLKGQTQLMLQLLRLMFPYMLLVCLAAVFIGMQNARGHFFVPAMGSTILNVTMIGSVFFLAPLMGKKLEQQIFGLAIGVLVAGIAQAVFQWYYLRREGYRGEWISPWGNETVRQVARKMIPGMMGVAAFQINVLVTNGLAFCVDSKIVASFDFAVRLMELPQGVFGISLATYLLPTLSGLAAGKKYPEFRLTLWQGMSHLIFVNLIASVLLFVLAVPIIRLLFEHGKFDSFATQQSAMALKFLAPGLVMFSLVNILARAFYALGDTQTPMKISIVCLLLNLVFALMFIWTLRQKGLGLANTLSAALNVSLLVYALRRKLRFLGMTQLRRNTERLLVATVFAGLAAWATNYFWEKKFGHRMMLEKAGAVFLPMSIATLVYFAIAMWLKVPSAREMFQLVREKLSSKRTNKS